MEHNGKGVFLFCLLVFLTRSSAELIVFLTLIVDHDKGN